MPRKRRIPKGRRGTVDVALAVQIWLLFHDYRAAENRDPDGLHSVYFTWDQTAAWEAMATPAIAYWAKRFPGTRPAPWWEWSAPELRQLDGKFTVIPGAGRCWPTGAAFIKFAADAPPLLESQPAFLDRLQLWLPGERRRVAPDAFAARRFSDEALTVTPACPADFRSLL